MWVGRLDEVLVVVFTGEGLGAVLAEDVLVVVLADEVLTKSACAAFLPRSLSHSFLQPALPLPVHLTDNSRAIHTLVTNCEI